MTFLLILRSWFDNGILNYIKSVSTAQQNFYPTSPKETVSNYRFVLGHTLTQKTCNVQGLNTGLGKTPGFSSKTQPSGFNWFKLDFNGFYGLNWGKIRFPM